jgi:hypothetical protein
MKQAPEIYANDEIDLIALFQKLWAERLVVLLSVVIVGLLGVGYFLNSWFKQPQVSISNLEVRFNFPGIQNATYPNGQPFSLNDLVAPAILNHVFSKQNLREYGLSSNDFIEAVQIAPYATNRVFIESKFKSGLNNKKLSVAEIDELNTNYSKALDAASLRFARLTFTIKSSLALPENVMTSVLTAIPATWARESIERYGVLDIALATIGELDTGLIDNYEYLVSAQYLDDYLQYVTKSAKVLQEDEVGRLLVDLKTKLSVDDIIEALSTLKEFHVNVLQRSFAVVPVVRNREEASFYLNNQIIIDEERLDQLRRQAAVVDQAYSQLLDSSGRDISINNQQNSNAQYGDDFLARLISIGDELSESKFKQSLLNRSIGLKLKAEEVITRVSSLKKNLDALELGVKVSDIINKRVDAEVKFITVRLQKLAGVINRLGSLRSERALGQSGVLYDLNSEPKVVSNFRGQIKSLVKYSIFGAIAGLFLGFCIAFILAIVKTSRQA